MQTKLFRSTVESCGSIMLVFHPMLTAMLLPGHLYESHGVIKQQLGRSTELLTSATAKTMQGGLQGVCHIMLM
jgi:hypothetical protein